jgi:thiosulfate dehydrogenase [quinone] large subunit
MSTELPLSIRRRDAAIAYTFLRVIFGINFFNHGFTRLDNLVGFAQSMADMFQETFAPSWLVWAIGFCVPIVELIVGALLIVGWKTLPTLMTGFGLMGILMYGVTLLQNWDTATSQLIYCLVFFILILFNRYNFISLDGVNNNRRQRRFSAPSTFSEDLSSRPRN